MDANDCHPLVDLRGLVSDMTADNINEPTLDYMQFLTVAEVAAMMRVSKMTVYRLVHSGELPAARVGRSFRVPRETVHDYLRNAYHDAG